MPFQYFIPMGAPSHARLVPLSAVLGSALSIMIDISLTGCPTDYHAGADDNWSPSPVNATWQQKCYREPYQEWGTTAWEACRQQCFTLYCDDQYCDMARPLTIDNQDEQEFIEQTFGATADCCSAGGGSDSCCRWTGLGYVDPDCSIGLNCAADAGSGVWWWLTQPERTSDFRAWADGIEPADGCAAMGLGGLAGWQSEDCRARHRCICEIVAPASPSPPAPPSPLRPPPVAPSPLPTAPPPTATTTGLVGVIVGSCAGLVLLLVLLVAATLLMRRRRRRLAAWGTAVPEPAPAAPAAEMQAVRQPDGGAAIGRKLESGE
tara:strand:+ start:669 stop:1628 length:960 start_codon:yes stop_codon:yes gene_type:complete